MAVVAGSSPHARGLHHLTNLVEASNGIIPAHAGFTAGVHPRVSRPPDHPRTRGVYVARSPPTIVGGGSSPHARGLPEAREGPSPPARIIPARAGFTTPHPRRIRRGGDHPRTRGVYPDDSSVAQRHAGSSPHARGLQAPAGPARRVHRIIPARAGFTSGSSPSPSAPWDHPRTRGVYSVTGPYGAVTRWIIPARAGFTGVR